MSNAFVSAVDRLLDQPAWQRLLLLALFSAGCGVLLYLLLLSSGLQQQRQGRQKNADLQQKIFQQQKTLIMQPALAVLLQQQSLLISRQDRAKVLLEQITTPLRESKSTLVKWLPTASDPASSAVEQGSLSVRADFNGLLTLMRQLIDSPGSPTFSQLSLQAAHASLDVQLMLTAEALKPMNFATVAGFARIERDPFLAAKIAPCPDPTRSFKDVVLGGVMGNAEQLHGWLRWPGTGWQKVSPGWRDSASGWQVDSVERGWVIFDLDHPNCDRQIFKLRLNDQSVAY